MCCLPNQFPLPIFLLINKSDEIDRGEKSPWLESGHIKSYVDENQFFKSFYISSKNDKDGLRESTLSNQSVDIDMPLKEMIRTIFMFKDIKEAILKSSNINTNKQALIKSNTISEGESKKKQSKCIII